MAQKRPTKVFLWVSRVVGGLGIAVVLWAIIGGLLGNTGVSTPPTLLLLALCGFLVAIWALLYEFREYGVGPKQ